MPIRGFSLPTLCLCASVPFSQSFVSFAVFCGNFSHPRSGAALALKEGQGLLVAPVLQKVIQMTIDLGRVFPFQGIQGQGGVENAFGVSIGAGGQEAPYQFSNFYLYPHASCFPKIRKKSNLILATNDLTESTAVIFDSLGNVSGQAHGVEQDSGNDAEPVMGNYSGILNNRPHGCFSTALRKLAPALDLRSLRIL